MSDNPFLKRFDREFAPRLDQRATTLRRMFELLIEQDRAHYNLLETGCARTPGNWAGDGQSSILLDSFLQEHPGSLYSVDLDEIACANVRAQLSDRAHVTCQDSVRYLHELSRSRPDLRLDLLYLDSYDLDWSNPHPSALHHLKELCAARPIIGSGTLIVIDDTIRTMGVLPRPLAENKTEFTVFRETGLVGKGIYVDHFLRDIGCRRVFTGYQIGYRFE